MSDKSTVLTTIGVGEKYELLATLAADSFERHTGYPVHILGAEAVQRHKVLHPHYLKFCIFREFPLAQTVVYIDADLICLKPFRIDTYSDINKLVCVRDVWDRDWIQEDAQRVGISARNYFNSGFFIVNRSKHVQMLELALSLSSTVRSPFKDQTALNAACHALGVETHFLGKQYNYLGFEECTKTDGVVIGHLSGISRRPPETIRFYHQFWTRHATQISQFLVESEHELAHRCFEYERVGYDRRIMQLKPGGSIGIGRGSCEESWELTDFAGNFVLWIIAGGQPTCALVKDGKGGWRGRWMKWEEMPVILRPL